VLYKHLTFKCAEKVFSIAVLVAAVINDCNIVFKLAAT
jgi:hypothetical protein